MVWTWEWRTVTGNVDSLRQLERYLVDEIDGLETDVAVRGTSDGFWLA